MEAIDAGAQSAPDVMSHHSTRFNCGQCRHEIGNLIDARVNKSAQANKTPAE